MIRKKLKLTTLAFTLIELLSVIVLLAIIALIAVPIVLGIINDSKKSSDEQSIELYIDSVKKAIARKQLENSSFSPSTCNIQDNGNLLCSNVEIIIDMKGTKPNNGIIEIKNNKVTYKNLLLNGKWYNRKIKLTSEDAPTGYKGVLKVVYLDPTDLTKSCTKEEAEENVFVINNSSTPTGKKSGCMKWYVYKKENGFYKMILDHNTTPRIIFSSKITENAASTELMMNEINAKLTEDTKNWDLSTDQSNYSSKIKEVAIITGEEVKTITEKTSVNLTKENWFYFEGTGTKYQTLPAKYKSGSTSAYEWLYNYTNSCSKFNNSSYFGCSVEDNNKYKGQKLNSQKVFEEAGGLENSYGYWTNTITNNSTYVLYISRDGHISTYLPVVNNFGIRPVITVSSMLID